MKMKRKKWFYISSSIFLLSSLIVTSVSVDSQKVLAAKGKIVQEELKADSNAEVIALENGDFENPIITSNTWQYFTETEMEGWQTTASDGFMELQTNGYEDAKAVSGKQWAELNANEISALYQDISTIPGVKVHWQAYHKGRHGIDEAVVEFGSPNGTMVQQAEMTDDKTEWGLYRGHWNIHT